MDCQSGIVSQYTTPQDGFIDRAAGVLKAARQAGLLVIHVQVGFRPGLPEVSGRNKLFGAIKASPQWQRLFAGDAAAIHPLLGPEPNDIVIAKDRVGAFAGTDLQMILRANDVDTLILFGIATSGVVLSTLTAASDLDYRLAVIGDCCADRDLELHACLIQRLFPARADVITASEFARALAPA
jgi:nicotinamidase-related amidase